MEIGVIFATLLLLIFLFFIIRLILGPLKVLTRFFLHCGIALACLVLVNLIGQYYNIHIPINPISVLSIGLMGIPGFVLVAFLTYVFM